MTESEAENLAQRVVAGERDAFDEIVRLCHTTMFRLANRMLRNRDDAQEVVQEAFLAAYEGISRFKGQSKLSTWLLSITFNKAVDRLKRTTRDNWYIAGDLEKSEKWEIVERVTKFTDWPTNPEQNFRAAEIKAALNDALAEIPAESRAVFELRDVQGLTSKEVAEALGIGESNVRVRLHRVRQFLMVAMQNFYSGKGG